MAPHRGSEVWGLHLIAASDCIELAERNPGRRGAPRDLLWFGEPEVENGFIRPLDQPGFGVTLNQEIL